MSVGFVPLAELRPHSRGRRVREWACHGRQVGTGDNGGVTLYRDEGVVLRTQKLGEADRIVTMLTRAHGPGPRGGQGRPADQVASSAPGSSRSATSTCSSTPAARSTSSPRPRSSPRSAATSSSDYAPLHRRAPRCSRPPSGSPPRSASRRCSCSCCSSAALRSLADGCARARTRARRLPAAVAGRRRAGRRRSTTCARCGDAGAAPLLLAVGGGGVVCAGCRPPGAATPPRRAIDLLAALLDGRLGRRRRERCSGTAARAAAWSRPTCSGTSSAGCGRCAWSSAR